MRDYLKAKSFMSQKNNYIKMPSLIRDSSANNFNLLRLVLASLVVLGHFKGLAGNEHFGFYSYADFAVHAFFVVSGYLIAWSYFKDSNLINFYIRRFFRIYPLYFFVVIMQAIVMLLLLGHFEEHVAGTIKYLAAHLTFLNFFAYDIDGIASYLPDPGINGSLWTLKIEVAFYLLLPFICMLYKRYRFLCLALIYLLSTAFFFYFTAIGKFELAKQLPGQLRFFVIGIALYLHKDSIVLPKYLLLIAVVVSFTLCSFFRTDLYFNLIYPCVVGLLVFICAMRLPVIPLKFDISYGVYLLHAPIIQVSLLLGLFQDTYSFLAGLFVVVFMLAFLVEHVIEKPGIRLGKYLSSLRK